MKFIGDFHIHSSYSRSTSKALRPENLAHWARLKGITVIGTGDFTHPEWLQELQDKLEPAEEGLYRLKKNSGSGSAGDNKNNCVLETRFVLTAEISNIYKKKGMVRKVHNLLFAPDFSIAARIQEELGKIGNITSDGRPILGLDSRDLLEIALNCSERIFLVPAHIWTPWFSVLGAKSGFETVAECYDDLAPYISAVEMGLSSDPPMNWMCSFLDQYTLTANSDAHSPEKLGRNANLFDTELSYDAIIEAMRSGEPGKFEGTVSFFPQEGKYHYDGHRNCNICWDPVQTLQHDGICSVCGKKITIGVLNRVVQLSDREDLTARQRRLPYYSLIPLKELLSEIMGVGPQSKSVARAYDSLLKKAGSEFNILLHLPLGEVQKLSTDILGLAIERMRNGQVNIQPGFDGQFGQIKVFQEKELQILSPQKTLFSNLIIPPDTPKNKKKLLHFDLDQYRRLAQARKLQSGLVENTVEVENDTGPQDFLAGLNPDQLKAAEHLTGPALIIAGPGTGKTRTLTCRIANLIKNKGIAAAHILAITFTNKAAQEMRTRLQELLGYNQEPMDLTISTFHAFGYSILKRYHTLIGRDENFLILDDRDKEYLLKQCVSDLDKKMLRELLVSISHLKQQVLVDTDIADPELATVFRRYELSLKENNVFDLDDLIYQPLKLLARNPEIVFECRDKYQWVLIDEYQDINSAQYALIRKLLPDLQPNIVAIGDFDQAIYGFRGADVRFINNFLDDFPDAEIYRLSRSYRCSDLILQASSGILARKKAATGILQGIKAGVKVQLVHQNTGRSEAEFVARTIEDMIGGLQFFSIDSNVSAGEAATDITSLSDFVILCRIKEQISTIEKALIDHKIPYQAIGDVPFFQQEPVRALLDLFKLSRQPTQKFLLEKALKDKYLRQHDVENVLAEIMAEQMSVPQKITKLIDLYGLKHESGAQDKFKKLLHYAENFADDTQGFLQFVALGTNTDTYDAEVENVTVMTIHAAKGLEFECVFIIGCEDGLIPYSLFESQQSNVEEEKRLLYVGMTRAKQFLFLSYAARRLLYGREHHLARSPFLDQIERELFEIPHIEYKSRLKKEKTQLNLFELFDL
ncbi:UvrD-helicase domain-containing protein [candidate division CSSED10-310 bacterium]|uniref:DNA 3'-5' helicase n=1 Tax=candidate division CSSED10-310 bacterium TaxID=2855610 RepID=A0ABV6Z279_UNCC1